MPRDTLLIIVVVLLLLFGGAGWGSYSGRWGYGPSGLIGALLFVLLLLILLGRI